MGVKIVGLGHYAPERVVTNDELSTMMDTSDEWIRTRTGIKERRFAAPEESCSDMAFRATQEALNDAQLSVDDIDCVLVASLSPDHMFPGTSSFLQAKMNRPGIPVVDIRAQCSGFLYSLAIGRSMVLAGAYRRMLIVGVEIQSKALDFTTEGRDIAVLFGDGAGAAVIECCDCAEDEGVVDVELGGDGRYAKDLWCPAPGMAFPAWGISDEMKEERLHFPQMNGRKVFQFATAKMDQLARNMMERHQLSETDLCQVICHQANSRIIEYVQKSLGWNSDKFFVNIDRYGNTTAASIPIALSEVKKAGRIPSGGRVLMLAFGSGFTWGSALVRF